MTLHMNFQKLIGGDGFLVKEHLVSRRLLNERWSEFRPSMFLLRVGSREHEVPRLLCQDIEVLVKEK